MHAKYSNLYNFLKKYGKPPGQYLNKSEFMTNELKENAVKNGALYFNVNKLHEWFKFIDKKKHNEIKELRKHILTSLIDFDKLKSKSERIKILAEKKDNKICDICSKIFKTNWELERHKSAKNPQGHKSLNKILS